MHCAGEEFLVCTRSGGLVCSNNVKRTAEGRNGIWICRGMANLRGVPIYECELPLTVACQVNLTAIGYSHFELRSHCCISGPNRQYLNNIVYCAFSSGIAALNAAAKSAMMSLIASIPTDTRMRSGVTPLANCSSVVSC